MVYRASGRDKSLCCRKHPRLLHTGSFGSGLPLVFRVSRVLRAVYGRYLSSTDRKALAITKVALPASPSPDEHGSGASHGIQAVQGRRLQRGLREGRGVDRGGCQARPPVRLFPVLRSPVSHMANRVSFQSFASMRSRWSSNGTGREKSPDISLWWMDRNNLACRSVDLLDTGEDLDTAQCRHREGPRAVCQKLPYYGV